MAMDGAARVWLVYDGGDIVSLHASRAGADQAKSAYIDKTLREEAAESGAAERHRAYLERFITIEELPLLP